MFCGVSSGHTFSLSHISLIILSWSELNVRPLHACCAWEVRWPTLLLWKQCIRLKSLLQCSMKTGKHGDSGASLLKLLLVCMTALSNIVWLPKGVPFQQASLLVGLNGATCRRQRPFALQVSFTCPSPRQCSSPAITRKWNHALHRSTQMDKKKKKEQKGNRLCWALEC